MLYGQPHRSRRADIAFWMSSESTVRRLSGLDALFLELETVEQPMQIGVVGLLRSYTGGSLTLEDLRHHLAARIDQLTAFRCRVIPIPLGLAHPVMVKDPDFDLKNHLHQAVLPGPGKLEELDAACAQLFSSCLDRDRPLWRITLIDGLADGRQAIVLEVHHALMDAFAIRTTLTRIFSEEEPAACPSPWLPGRMPGRVQLFVGALAFDVRVLARLPRLVARMSQATRAVRRRQAQATVKLPMPRVDVPLSDINLGFTPGRRFTWVSLSLEDILVVKDVAGVTVNDVALAVVGGTLRGYLHARGALPDQPLVAFVPVGMEKSTVIPRAQGNRISGLTTSLATDVADPWERLHRISAVSAEAKACLDLMGPELSVDRVECIPPILMRRLVRRNQAAWRRSGEGRMMLDANVVVSNLRGPSACWRLGSAVVEKMCVAAPGTGIGVNFFLWDYAGHLMFGVESFSDSIDDPRVLSSRLSHCLKELVLAAEFRRAQTV